MPINQERNHKTLNFQYMNEKDEQFILEYTFHHTEEYGPTLTINNMQGGALSLPVSAYVDAVEHLRSEGAIAGGKPAMSPASPVSRPLTARLTPTRVASAAPVVRQPIVPVQSYPQQPQPNYDPGVSIPLDGYMPQHDLLRSDGAVESFQNPLAVGSRPSKPVAKQSGKMRPAPLPQPQVEVVEEDEEEGDDDEEVLPTLADAEVKKKSTPQQRRIGRRILKPNDPGYAEWLAEQQQSGESDE